MVQDVLFVMQGKVLTAFPQDGHSLFPSMKTVPNEVCDFAPFANNTDAAILQFLELYFPLRIDHYATITDSGGPGLHRGGNGVRIGAF